MSNINFRASRGANQSLPALPATLGAPSSGSSGETIDLSAAAVPSSPTRAMASSSSSMQPQLLAHFAQAHAPSLEEEIGKIYQSLRNIGMISPEVRLAEGEELPSFLQERELGGSKWLDDLMNALEVQEKAPEEPKAEKNKNAMKKVRQEANRSEGAVKESVKKLQELKEKGVWREVDERCKKEFQMVDERYANELIASEDVLAEKIASIDKVKKEALRTNLWVNFNF